MDQEREKVVKEIREMFPDVDWPNPFEDVVYVGRRDLLLLPDQKAIRDRDSGLVYAITSEKYNLVFHEEMVKVVIDALSEPGMQAFGKYDLKISIIGEGEKMKLKVTFPEVQYEIGQKDFINPSASVTNSYDTAWKARLIFGALRLVCTNGMTVGKAFTKFVKRHMPSLQVSEMTAQLIAGMNSYIDQTELWKKLTDIKVTEQKYAEIFEDLGVSDKRKEEIEAIPETLTKKLLPESLQKDDLSAWVFYNVLTQFSTHNLQSELVRMDFEEKVAKTFEKRF